MSRTKNYALIIMYFTLLAEGKKYNVAMPTYESYQEYIEAYFGSGGQYV